ncbi:hypothetical protein [Stenotrophomonas sp.]|uniref:hypothetical protein n=1 Tax=Stenotrophomonas sp. TaxID=69392 RepID=UPI002FC8E242
MEAITLFAQIDQSSVSPNGDRESSEWVFDAFVATEWVTQGRLPSEGMEDNALDEAYPVAIIAIDGKSASRTFKIRPNMTGTAWYQITVDAGKGLPARVVGGGEGEGEVSVTDIRRVDGRQAKRLDALVAMPKGNTPKLEELKQLFVPVDRAASVPDAVVVDVGQAALAALCMPGGGDPLLFVDLGWPTIFNRQGLPACLPDMTSTSATVLLTHWDWDHWGLALKSIKWAGSPKHCVITWNLAALDRPWVVPGVGKAWGSVKLSPMHWRFALALARRGNLYRWPSSTSFMSNQHLMVARVSGGKAGDRNNNGLVAVVADQSVGLAPRRAIVLPGDANYPNLPFCKPGWTPKYAFSGLAASHHGGKVTVAKIPPAASPAWLAMSVGMGNRYKHPATQAQRGYIDKGWTWQVPTSHRCVGTAAAAHAAHGSVLLTTLTERQQWAPSVAPCWYQPVQ